MLKLDRTKSFGIVSGHPVAMYQQDDLLFNASEELIGTPKTTAEAPPAKKEEQIQTDQLVSAKAFLAQILAGNALSKAVVYTEAEKNNQDWETVKNAAVDMGIVKFSFQKAETWRLPEQA